MGRSEESLRTHLLELKKEFKRDFGAPLEDKEIMATLEVLLAQKIKLFLDRRLAQLNPEETVLAAKILSKEKDAITERATAPSPGSGSGRGDKKSGQRKAEGAPRVLA